MSIYPKRAALLSPGRNWAGSDCPQPFSSSQPDLPRSTGSASPVFWRTLNPGDVKSYSIGLQHSDQDRTGGRWEKDIGGGCPLVVWGAS